MKVTVHHFRVYDGIKDVFIVPVRKSTADRIARIRGEIIQGSAEQVDAAALDQHERYDPRPPEDREV
jgi:DNA-binding cell septation regulator SpoVG